MGRTWPIILGQLRDVAVWCKTNPNYLPHAPALLVSRLRWAWRFSRVVRGFHATSADGITVHFTPDSWDRLDLDLLLMCCRLSRSDLARRFGFVIPRINAFVFEQRDSISALMEFPFAGFAMPSANSIVVLRLEHIEEMVRHELVHLFAARWNPNVPCILREGLAVWLARTFSGRSVDSLS